MKNPIKMNTSEVFFCICLFASVLFAQEQVLENFETYPKGGIPTGKWKARNGDPKLTMTIAQEGDTKYLQIRDIGKPVQYFKKVDWDIKKYPWVRWRWRVHEFPVGSNELNGKNDSAGGFYVVFPVRLFLPESIKYLWSEVLPPETVIRKKERFPYLVVNSGIDQKGKWVTVERNVYADFKKLFKRNTPDPAAIGFQTDADSTKSKASADYDDVVIMTGPSSDPKTQGVPLMAPNPKK